MTNEQPREHRFPCQGQAALFLSDKNGHTTMSRRLHGRLVDISCHGASLALAGIITERLHLIYTPMESDRYHLRLILYMEEGELILPVQSIWFNKKINNEELPFRVGLKFLEPLTSEQLKKIQGA